MTEKNEMQRVHESLLSMERQLQRLTEFTGQLRDELRALRRKPECER